MYNKCKITVLFLVFSLNIFAQKKLKTTALNRITFAKNDTLYRFFLVKPGKKIAAKSGVNYYWYRPDTILITNSGFDGRLLNGEYKVFYPNKNLKESGIFDEGVKTSEWRSWDESGRLLQVYNWKKGHLEGKFFIYGNDGKINQQGQYSKDSLTILKPQEIK
jgi:antitoxin component YwqK of YwqJK toxin-antitoxin module